MSRIFHLCTFFFFFFSSRRRHTRSDRDWSSDVCSSDLSLPCRAADAFRHAPLETLSPRPVEAPLREGGDQARSEEHTSELQARSDIVCRLLLEKKYFFVHVDGLNVGTMSITINQPYRSI